MANVFEMDSYLGWKVDFAAPPGVAAFAAPDSIQWRVFKNPIALAIGGVSAVLLEFADPRIRSGVWDHSTFKTDPIGRSQRTAMAAMVGVYGPQAAARRVIQGVTNMHARIAGETPSGEPYRALDTELLDWVGATAAYGFLNAYHRFVAPLSDAEKAQFYAEGEPVARLYGVQTVPLSDAHFLTMMQTLAPRFEPHPIVLDFLATVETAPAPFAVPRFLRRSLAQAAVSLLPEFVRDKLKLGRAYDLSPVSVRILRTIGALAERVPIADAPPAEACRRLGLPANFLYRSKPAQRAILADWVPLRSQTGAMAVE
jgi:uncharacterized protein (DUF2236 family)